MKPIQRKDPRITNISFDHFTGSVYIIDPNSNDENQSEFMLTSPRTNGADHFVPSHHLALITQPVLGARSRKKTSNTPLETSSTTTTTTTTKDKLDSMANSRRSSYNDSPPLILPINRIDTSQYQKKTTTNSHHESSDSGLDLSLSTNSSVQLQQYPQQHIPIHRPLSALNEDSSPDDGYHDEHQKAPSNTIRLRFPPVSFGRNRSMEDIISNNTPEQQQHRSSSFSDERQQKFSSQHEQKLQRINDGTHFDFLDTSPQLTDSHRRTNTIKNEHLYPPITQQHRSLNDLTNKTSNRVFPIRNESNMSTTMNNLPTTQTIIRQPNTSTLKPLRKKTKLNIIVEPLTPSRLAIYDEQTNTMIGTTTNSSNQTTPRSIHPINQQQIKSKTSTPLGFYSSQEQIKAHVNRSVVERQHPPTLPTSSRRGVIQQMIPFDASPSKVNNLLLRHHVQHNQPIILFHPNSNSQMSPTRQMKQTLPTLYDEEPLSNVHEEKRKQFKSKDYEEKKRWKEKDDFESDKSSDIHQKGPTKLPMKDTQESIPSKMNHRRRNSQEQFEQTNTQRHFTDTNEKQQEKDLALERNLKKKSDKNRIIEDETNFINTPLRQYEHNDTGGIYHGDKRQGISNDYNRKTTSERYGSGQSSSTMGKSHENQKINSRRNLEPVHLNRSEGIDEEQRIYKSKPTEFVGRNKPQNNTINKNHNRTTETNYSQGTQKNTLVSTRSPQSKTHSQTYETPTTRISPIQSQIDQNRQINQWQNSKYGNDHYPWKKSQSKPIRIQPINTNIYDSRRERETSRLSNISKSDSIQSHQKIIEKTSNGHLPTKSPTSWSIITEQQHDQQQLETYEKTNTYQSDLSTSPSSNEELIEENSTTPSRTYRLMADDQQQPPIDGRYVVPSNNFKVPPVIDPSTDTSSHHTYPFNATPDLETDDDTLVDNSPRQMENQNQKSIEPDVYTLSDYDNPPNLFHSGNSPSPLVHLSSNQTFSSPPPPPIKVTIPTEKDEMPSDYDSDDGWSDDSAELLYVDERYATEKSQMTPSSHLPSQQHHHYHLQQQNVLLQ